MLRSSLRACLLLICVLAFPQASPAGPGTQSDPIGGAQAAALTNWQVALSSFQKAGAFIGQGKYPQAKAELSLSATNLPAPYRNMASDYLERAEAALKQS